VLVVGDSHARAMVPALLDLADAGVLSVDLYTAGGCLWGEGRPGIADKQLRDGCSSLKGAMQPLIERSASSYAFVVTTGWTNKAWDALPDAPRGLARAWRPVAAQVPVVALRDNPSAGGTAADDPNICLVRVPAARSSRCDLDRRAALDRFPDPWKAAASMTPGARYLDMTRYYCDTSHCPAVIGGVDVYRDNSHVTVTYARTMAPYYLRAFQELGLLRR
jgi:hypothetical protein